MASSVPSQLLAAIKARRFTAVARLFAPDVQFEAWNPNGRWVAADPLTAARVIEVWFTPGSGSTVVWSNETNGARGAATLEFEMAWKAPPDDQPRTLRQVYLLTINKAGKIASARVYCPGLHTEFPEVDLEKQRRQKGLAAAIPKAAAGKVVVKAS
ncbi:MAG: nuclear transport factor 2 family protein [Chloroflexota bacterium]|nr:nuclear transport factor 2 family protein [Chloroflexota bacterium]